MVKIVNQFGDVKIGKQGEAVYQRKHGEQIRRTAAPKRAIPSEAQIAHRQLYRDALAWRSQLSLPNRRYLDGYCIANGIVDSYHIPLPWSRFALKLYLQKVGFVIAEKWTDYTSPPPARYEYFTEGSEASYWCGGATWRGQTFTPQESHKITSIFIKAMRAGSPGIVTVSIRATDGAGKPTGIDLCSGTINGNSFTTTYPGLYYEIDLPNGVWLEEGVKYSYLCRAPSGNSSNNIRLGNNTANAYPRGNEVYSYDSGVSWSSYANWDMNFEEWGKAADIAIKKATLHIRHPALLTVVHKRGGLAINGYDTLSSLDEEYLTGQVGIDVLSEDSIEATSLPGIEYKHRVILA